MATITQIVDETLRAMDLRLNSGSYADQYMQTPTLDTIAYLKVSTKEQLLQYISTEINRLQGVMATYAQSKHPGPALVAGAQQAIPFYELLRSKIEQISIERTLTSEEASREIDQRRFDSLVAGVRDALTSDRPTPVYYDTYQQLAGLASRLGVVNPYAQKGQEVIAALSPVSTSREESLAKLSGSVNIPIVTLDAAGNLVTRYQIPVGEPTKSDITIGDRVVGSAFTQPFELADKPVYVSQGVNEQGKTIQTIIMPDKDGKLRQIGTIVTKDGDALRDDTLQSLITKQLEKGVTPEQAVKNVQEIFTPKQDNTLLYLAILAVAIALGVTLFGKRKDLGKFFSTKGVSKKVIY